MDLSSRLFRRRSSIRRRIEWQVSIILHLDDPLDAIAVHCWNGTWGLIAPGLFSAEDLIANAYGNIPTTTNPRTHFGCFLGGDGNLLAAQLVDVLFIAGAQCFLQCHPL